MNRYSVTIGIFFLFFLLGLTPKSVFADNSTTSASSTLTNIRGAVSSVELAKTLPATQNGPGFTFTTRAAKLYRNPNARFELGKWPNCSRDQKLCQGLWKILQIPF